jgi:hypothetical protein
MMLVTLYIYYKMKCLVPMRFTDVTNTVLLACAVNMRRKGGVNTEQKAFRTMFNASFATIYLPIQSCIRQWEVADIPRINVHIGFTNTLLPVGCHWFVTDLKVTATCIWMTFRKDTTLTKLRNSSYLCRVTENVRSVGLSNWFQGIRRGEKNDFEVSCC